MLVFDHVEVQYHREAKSDEQPWIFVWIEIVEIDSSLDQFDWLIPNNDLMNLVWFDTEWKNMGKSKNDEEKEKETYGITAWTRGNV